MLDSIHGFDWTFIQSHLPFITFLLIGAPLSMLLYKDLIRLSAKNMGKNRVREVKVLSRMRDKDGRPVYMDVFRDPIKVQSPVVSISDFESRRVAAMRSTSKSRY